MTDDYRVALAIDALWSLTRVCRQLRDDHLQLPTPCSGWNLQRLLEHLTGQHHGMAAALAGAANDLAAWRPRPVGEGREALFASIREVRLALLSDFGEQAWMPEVRRDAPLPTAFVIRAHLVDTVAHGWDVAASLGLPIEFSPLVIATVYEAARQIPDGPDRDQPGAAFGHVLAGGEEPTLAGFLALLGRDSSWTPAA